MLVGGAHDMNYQHNTIVFESIITPNTYFQVDNKLFPISSISKLSMKTHCNKQHQKTI